ncbi:MAG: RNA methyltransferase [Polynucleobacter sp. 35-46-207]|nr:MAG: RNA methyltransferase [Polynucleobacter sp. 35-46-207]
MNTTPSQLFRWILLETSHPGNVGSAARALKTMGFDDLRLINPKIPNIAQEPEAIALASGAGDILKSSQEADSLDKAVEDCSLGLDNQHLSLCTHRIWLDANPLYPSLNLAQAIMVCAFTLREALNQESSPAEKDLGKVEAIDYADPAAVAAMLEHWRQGLESIGFLDPSNPKKLMTRLQALFARARLHKEEVDLLRGIAKQMLLKK